MCKTCSVGFDELRLRLGCGGNCDSESGKERKDSGEFHDS